MQKKQRPIILILTRFYLPGFRGGGPLRSLANLINYLKTDYDFRLICCDRDYSSAKIYPNIKLGSWNSLNGVKVFYIDKKDISLNFYNKIYHDLNPNLIYLNSFFDFYYSILPFLIFKLKYNLPTIVAPRGELSSEALKFKKIQKILLLKIIKLSNITKNIIWHITSNKEKKELKFNMKNIKNNFFLIPNLSATKLNKEKKIYRKKRGILNIVLFARIAPMKNTLGAIQIVSKLSGEVNFDLIGPIGDPVYWNKCKEHISKLPNNIKVNYLGEFSHESLVEIIKNYDLMFMPTLGENFGHSIIEALCSGLPVVISNLTPFKNLESFGVGYDIPLNDKKFFINVLKRFQDMTDREINKIRNLCLAYAMKFHLDRNKIINKYKNMFDSVLNKSIH